MSMVVDPLTDIIPIDYNVGVEILFSCAAVVLFHKVGLRLLSAVIGKSAIPGLPTWVPDWTMSLDIDKLHNKLDHDAVDLTHPAGGPPDWTAAEVIDDPNHNPDWSSGSLPSFVLKVRGVRVGQIRWIGEPWDPRKGDWKTTVRQWKSLMLQAGSLCEYPTARPIDKALSTPGLMTQTAMAEHAYKATYPTISNGSYTRSFEKFWKCQYDDNTTFGFFWPTI
jgi:hypothetical protein